jgi:hypothetical protein
LAREMNLDETWEGMFMKVKEVGKCGLQIMIDGKLYQNVFNLNYFSPSTTFSGYDALPSSL